MNQNQKTLALCIATAMMLAACGGEDGDGNGRNEGNTGNNPVNTTPGNPNDPGTNPGAQPNPSPAPGLLEDWRDYKTIADRCALISGLQKYHLDDINCLRGVFRGKLGNDDGRSCEIEFMGTDGLRMTVAGNSYTYVPPATKNKYLEWYRNSSYTKPRPNGDGSFIFEKELYAVLDYTGSRGRDVVTFQLYNGKYDANYWLRNGNGDRPIDFPSYIKLSNFPGEMGEALNISLTYFDHLRTTCLIESATFY